MTLYIVTMVPIGAGTIEQPLKDMGFDLVPRADWTAFATDGVGIACAGKFGNCAGDHAGVVSIVRHQTAANTLVWFHSTVRNGAR